MKLKGAFASIFCVVLLSGCGSGASTGSGNQGFDRNLFVDNLKSNHEDCQLNYLTSNHKIESWNSTRESEASKYSWVEYSPDYDYYQFRIDDPSFKQLDVNQVVNTKKCISFLSNEISKLTKIQMKESSDVLPWYTELRKNRESYLISAQKMADLPITKANRTSYLELEDQKRNFDNSKDAIFTKIREMIDYQTRGAVQIFIERCPDAFSVLGQDTNIDGSVLLTNVSPTSQFVDITFRFKDTKDGTLVGSDRVAETVPGNSKLRHSISAAGSSGPVGGGATFPATCTFE